MCFSFFSFVEYTEHQTKYLFSQCVTLALRHHMTLFRPRTYFISTRRCLDSREQSADRIFRFSSRRMFERFVTDMCVFQRIQWKLIVVKCVAYSDCLYFKTTRTKIVRSSSVDYSEDGNSKLLRNIGHISGEWNRLHRHCCKNLRCLTVSSFHRAEHYSLLKSKMGGRGLDRNLLTRGRLVRQLAAKAYGSCQTEMLNMWTGPFLSFEIKYHFEAVVVHGTVKT